MLFRSIEHLGPSSTGRRATAQPHLSRCHFAHALYTPSRPAPRHPLTDEGPRNDGSGKGDRAPATSASAGLRHFPVAAAPPAGRPTNPDLACGDIGGACPSCAGSTCSASTATTTASCATTCKLPRIPTASRAYTSCSTAICAASTATTSTSHGPTSLICPGHGSVAAAD